MSSQAHYYGLDYVDPEQIKRKKSVIQSDFRSYVYTVVLLELCLISMSVFQIAYFHYFLSPLLHSVLLIRVCFLVLSLRRNLNPLNMLGTLKWLKIVRLLSFYPELGIWFWLGYLDLSARVCALAADLLYFCLFSNSQVLTPLFPYTIVLDLMYIGEYTFSVTLLYYRGVYNNVRRHLRPDPRRSLAPPPFTSLSRSRPQIV